MKPLYIPFLCVVFGILFSRYKCDVCQTDTCKKLSEELKTIMNKNVNPCDDFSSYICGNFDKLYSILPGEIKYDSMSLINNKISNELKKLIESQDLSNQSLPQTKAAMFYKSCININARNKNSIKILKEYVANLNRDLDFEMNLIKLLKSGVSTSLFGIYSSSDPNNSTYNILFIGKPQVILPEANLKADQSPVSKKQIENYLKFMERVLGILGLWNNDKSLLKEIITFHIKIAKSLPSVKDQIDPSKYAKVTIQELQKRCSQLSWKRVINGVLKNVGKEVKDNDIIMVFSINYIDSMCAILTEYKSDSRKKIILQKNLVWQGISSLVSVGSDNLMKFSDDLVADIYGATGTKQLWKKCLDLTANLITDIVGNMYVKTYFQASKKHDIEFMLKNLISTFKDTLTNITWMDSKTKFSALKKLGSMKYKIGYPESLLSETKLVKDNENVSMKLDYFMENYIKYQEKAYNDIIKEVGEKIPEDKWEMAAHQVNAYYNPTANEIVFPAAILQYPFYDIDLPVSYNYGGIGMVLGHEILHGFDTIGSKFDENGMLKEWWSAESKREYEIKTKCITDQYGKYQMFNQSLIPEQTVSEDIADNAGLRISNLAAYSRIEQRKKLTLPGLHFTSEQLVFVGEARVWCSLYTRNAAIQRIQNNEHTIWKFRINGPISNIPQFSTQFQCNRNSPMNNIKKCLVW